MQAVGNSRKVKKVSPRPTPPRHDRYMALAFMYSALSKDPRTQHGAQIITMDNEPLGWGYNGPPQEINDGEINWDRPDKYPYIVHAEVNAIRHSDPTKVKGSVIYVTGKPCPPCMLEIVDAKIFKVIYYDGQIYDSASSCADPSKYELSDDIARKGGVTLEPFTGDINWLRDWMASLEEKGVFNTCHL